MRQYTLDGNNMTTLEAAYDEFEQVFALPDYFGRNLDALEECLAELAHQEGTIEIVVTDTRTVEEALPEWERIVEIFVGNPYVSLSQE